MIKRPYIINLAPTGIVHTKNCSPHVPVTHNEIIEVVDQCIELGVQMFHLHARQKDQSHSNDPEQYGRLIERIRKLNNGQEVILGVTASGREKSDFESRAAILDLDGAMKPDMASLTLSSLNFQKSASLNSPDTIRKLALRMQERNIRPELEVFDMGMLNFAQVLIKEGVIPKSSYANLLFGNVASAQCTALQCATMLQEVPSSLTCCVGGLGVYQLQSNLFGLMFADGVRTGLEDSLYLNDKTSGLATNIDLVQRIKRLAAELNRPLESIVSLRDRFLGGNYL